MHGLTTVTFNSEIGLNHWIKVFNIKYYQIRTVNEDGTLMYKLTYNKKHTSHLY